jgi:hypothetical protein
MSYWKSICNPYTGTCTRVDGLGNLRTVKIIRLVGTAFSGTSKDTNFWTETVTGAANQFRMVGRLTTNPQGYYAGTNATTVLKYGAGELIRITVCDNVGTLIAYDNTTNSGTVLCNIDASKTTGTLEFGMPFSNGLTIVTASTPKMTVVYE